MGIRLQKKGWDNTTNVEIGRESGEEVMSLRANTSSVNCEDRIHTKQERLLAVHTHRMMFYLER
jgi:hypothetical protein